jgi:hypothetical protein
VATADVIGISGAARPSFFRSFDRILGILIDRDARRLLFVGIGSFSRAASSSGSEKAGKAVWSGLGLGLDDVPRRARPRKLSVEREGLRVRGRTGGSNTVGTAAADGDGFW